MSSYRKGRTIRDRLIKSDQPTSTFIKPTFLGQKNLGSYPCLSCIQCNSMIKGKVFAHPHRGFNIPIRGYYTCQSSYVIYAIKCPCGLVYVGETTQKVKDRIARHKYSIRDKLTRLPLARHFVEYGHNASQLKYMVLEGIEKNRRGGNREITLRKREVYWIHFLNTIAPYGLNVDLDLYLFI